MSAKPKRMHHRFHWKPPVGLGRVTFRLLIKWCVRARARRIRIRARAPYPRARARPRVHATHARARTRRRRALF